MKHQRQKSLILTTNSAKAAIMPAKVNLFSSDKNEDFETYIQALNNLGISERCFIFCMEIDSLN